jgi:ribosome biogenesis protein ERB1
MPHIGYDISGKKIFRPAHGDELDKFLETVDDPASWYVWICFYISQANIQDRTTAFDKKSQMDKPLTSEELDIIQRLQKGENPDGDYDPYEPTVEWFTSKQEIMPLSAAPEPKRRWVRSKWEKQKVNFIIFPDPPQNLTCE